MLWANHMDQLPSSKSPKSPSSKSLEIRLTGLLKSSHSLLGVLVALTLVGLGLCLKFNFPFGAYAFCLLFIISVLLIVTRFALKGPEADRVQPSVSLTHQDNRVQAHFLNVEMSAQMLAAFQSVLTRRPLPAPSAIIEGLASDPASFRPLTIEEAQALAQQDAQLLSPPPVATPEAPPSNDPTPGL
jgi:hypothetical protein